MKPVALCSRAAICCATQQAPAAEIPAKIDGDGSLAEKKAYEETLICKFRNKAAINQGPDTPLIEHLALAADQFIVARPTQGQKSGSTVIAGYPWFGDWGRDTMIAIPGLTLETGRSEEALQMIEGFLEMSHLGIIPNNFPDEGQAPMYNTSDGTLWLFNAMYMYYLKTGDKDAVERLYPKLMEILNHHIQGTINDIYMDTDGLLSSGNEDTQLTWMDVKVNGWVVTPRHGKAVEINALWYNALSVMDAFTDLLKVCSGIQSINWKQIDKVDDYYISFTLSFTVGNYKDNCMLFDTIKHIDYTDDEEDKQILEQIFTFESTFLSLARFVKEYDPIYPSEKNSVFLARLKEIWNGLFHHNWKEQPLAFDFFTHAPKEQSYSFELAYKTVLNFLQRNVQELNCQYIIDCLLEKTGKDLYKKAYELIKGM